jgi:predicted lipid-binding transport protein (Tim44 family)
MAQTTVAVPHRRAAPRALTLALLAASILLPAAARARGGGGCLEEGTRVATPLGERAVEALRPGAPVWTVVGGRLQPARVMAVTRVEPEEYLELAAGGAVLRVTPEHPLQVAAGVFRTAERLAAGEAIYLRQGDVVSAARLERVRRVKASRPAYNLLVQPGGTFLANGLLVHNKGCFLPDTPIARADGTAVAIADVRPGDALLAFTPEGEVVTTTVREVITHEVERYVELETEHASLRVTEEHPFFVGEGTFETVEALRVGDRVFLLQGGALRPERIVAMRAVERPARVYNLQTDRPNTFFAGGVAVHNKGGGGGGGSHGGGGFHSSGSHGGGGSGDPRVPLVIFGLFGAFFVWGVIQNKRQKENQDLDFSYSRAQIAQKAGKTEKLLEFLGKVDPAMKPAELRVFARSTFLKLQQCWEARDYEPMRPLLMPDLWREHAAQLLAMKANHEIDKIADLEVNAVDVVNVRYPYQEHQREFTVLFTATARDHYVDDRTGKYLRGDTSPAQFQEFWTFQRKDGTWLLREIEQTRESDALKDENFFEQFTDVGRDRVYGEAAGAAGPAGPWLEKAVETKATKIERLLAFLVQTDKLWDRQAMLETARRVFLDVTLSRERGDPAAIPAEALFPEVAAALRDELGRVQASGLRYEFRNLCVRKVELILVRNFADNARDEFTVRISAHAQRGVLRGGATVRQDPDVTPFTQFWTFGRLDRSWRLKEVLPEARGEEAMRAENLDEDSSPEQVQWYYRQTRAR